MGFQIRQNKAVLTQARTWIYLFVAIHLILAAGYAKVTPYRTPGLIPSQATSGPDIGAPDERQHVNYILYLAQKHEFPVLRIGDGEMYEAHQPPLFYLLGQGWSRLSFVGDLQNPECGLSVRFLNCIIGALGVLGVAFLARWATGKENVALMATGFAALLPMNAALSGSVSNDPLLIALCVWALAVCARILSKGWTIPQAAALTVLCGLALLTKTTSLALLPVAALTPLLLRDASLAKRFLRAACLAAVPLLIALPWLLRNQSLYGDPFAMKAFNDAFKGAMMTSTAIERMGLSTYVYQMPWATFCSFVGVFGYWDIWLPNQIYALVLLAIVGLGTGWALSLKSEPQSRPIHLINGIFLLLIVALFVRFNMQYFQAQGRYILPALGPISVAIGCGVDFFGKRRVLAATAVLCAAAFLANVWILESVLPDQFSMRMHPQAQVER